MGTVDLDAARAARAAKAEATGQEHSVILGGETFVLPNEMPLEASLAFRDEGLAGYVRIIMGDQWPKFLAQKPTFADIEAMNELVGELYGFGSLGESPASDSSSSSNGNGSRPTSRASTTSTSRKRSGARRS